MRTTLALLLDYAAPPQLDGNAFLTYAAVSPYMRYLIEHDYGGLQHPNFTCTLCDSTLDFFKTFVYNRRAYNFSAYGGGSGGGRSGRSHAGARQRHDVLVWMLEQLQERRAARLFQGEAEPWVCGVQIRGPMSDFAHAWPHSVERYTAGADTNLVFGISSDFLFRASVAFPLLSSAEQQQQQPSPLDVRLLHFHGRRISLADCLTPVAGSSASFRHLTAIYLTNCFDLDHKGLQPPRPRAAPAAAEDAGAPHEGDKAAEGGGSLFWDAWMPSLRVLYISGGLLESLDFLVTPSNEGAASRAVTQAGGEGNEDDAGRPRSALEEVYFFNCPIFDASALAACRALRVVVLTSHALTDISWMSALHLVRYVDLTEDIGVTDLSPLAALPQLEVLRASGSGCTSLLWALLTEDSGHGHDVHVGDSLRYLDISGSLFLDDSAFIDDRVAAHANARHLPSAHASGGGAVPRVFQSCFPQLRIFKMSGSGATQLSFLALDYKKTNNTSHDQEAGTPSSSPWVLFPALEKIDLSSCSNLFDLSALSHLSNTLRALDARSISQHFDLPLPEPESHPWCKNWLQTVRFAQLEQVNFSFCGGITQLTSLAFLSHCLRHLSLRSCEGLVSLAGLETCTRLERLDVTLCHNLEDISALAGLGGSLRALFASVTAITDINSVFRRESIAEEGNSGEEEGSSPFMPSPFVYLQDINLADVTELSDVSVLWELPALRRLDLSDCESLMYMEVAAAAASATMGHQQLTQRAKQKKNKWLREKKRWVREHFKLERVNVSGCHQLSDQSQQDIRTYIQPAALKVLEVFTSDEDEADDLETFMA